MSKKFTEVEIQEILSTYRDPSVKQREICEKFGMHPQLLSRILRKYNEPFRRPNYGSKTSTTKESKNTCCPTCRRKIDIQGAKFCPFCGSDIRTPKDILIERLENLKTSYVHLPVGERDEFIKTINDSIAELKK